MCDQSKRAEKPRQAKRRIPLRHLRHCGKKESPESQHDHQRFADQLTLINSQWRVKPQEQNGKIRQKTFSPRILFPCFPQKQEHRQCSKYHQKNALEQTCREIPHGRELQQKRQEKSIQRRMNLHRLRQEFTGQNPHGMCVIFRNIGTGHAGKQRQRGIVRQVIYAQKQTGQKQENKNKSRGCKQSVQKIRLTVHAKTLMIVVLSRAPLWSTRCIRRRTACDGSKESNRVFRISSTPTCSVSPSEQSR